MNTTIKGQNINSTYKVKIINCFLLVGLILVLLAGSAYCVVLSISPTISLEEGELKLDRLKMAVAGDFFGVNARLMLERRGLEQSCWHIRITTQCSWYADGLNPRER
jgi:hypothetical protein